VAYHCVEAVGRSLFAAQGLRFTYTGTEHIPATGGAVVAINHTAYVDPLYAGLAVREAKRWLRFMAKDEVFDHPVAGPIMRSTGQIAVDRDRGGDALPEAVAALRAGELVGVYPEATISRSFELKGFKTGAARMAAEAGVPIVPMIVWGAQRIWTKGVPRRLGRTRTPIRVAIGPPLTPGDDPQATTDELRTAMSALLEQVHRDYGPYPPGEYWVPARFGGGAPLPEDVD